MVWVLSSSCLHSMRLREVGRIAQVTGWYEPGLGTEGVWLWELDIHLLAPLPHLRKPQPRLGYAKDGARQGGEDQSLGQTQGWVCGMSPAVTQ